MNANINKFLQTRGIPRFGLESHPKYNEQKQNHFRESYAQAAEKKN